MDRRRLVALAVIAVLVAWLAVRWMDPARAIHRRLDQLESLLSKEGREEQIATFGVARQVAKLFAPGFVVLAAPYEGQISGQQQLVGAVHRYRTTGDRMVAVIDQREIEVRENRTAISTFRATVTMTIGDRTGRDSFRVLVQWQDDDGEWLINRLEVVEVIEQGASQWF